MRRLLRTLGAGRHPDARASFFLLPLAELLPRDGEKRRKARQRSRKGRPQPESARETGRGRRIRARNSFLLGLRFPGLSGARLREGGGRGRVFDRRTTLGLRSTEGCVCLGETPR
ncbi:hypothetical protein NDU88_002634 [Pleurodeles waltl]|uniref:Uncharacterized protein n=1 Tax=Pleurodeles waltl TaxID=8319 RepID=A0AAV7REC8_PLEWA|nr:hypothetical protein NDU88_002634 [Pleurodeles waltl]